MTTDNSMTLTPATQPIARSVPATAAAAGIGKSTIWALIAEGRLPCIKLGSRTLILDDDLKAFLDQHRAPRRMQGQP